MSPRKPSQAVPPSQPVASTSERLASSRLQPAAPGFSSIAFPQDLPTVAPPEPNMPEWPEVPDDSATSVLPSAGRSSQVSEPAVKADSSAHSEEVPQTEPTVPPPLRRPDLTSSVEAAAEAREEAERKRKRRRFLPLRIVLILLVVLIVVGAATVAGGFIWLRWFYADDIADFQGTWYLAGTNTPITITEDHIQLTDDVSYRYILDPENKTFELFFGNLVGGGRYRFSLDRTELALVDGSFEGSDTLGDDFSWTLQAVTEAIQEGKLSPESAGTQGVTLLCRVPDTEAGAPPVASQDSSEGGPVSGDALASNMDEVSDSALDVGDAPSSETVGEGEDAGESEGEGASGNDSTDNAKDIAEAAGPGTVDDAIADALAYDPTADESNTSRGDAEGDEEE